MKIIAQTTGRHAAQILGDEMAFEGEIDNLIADNPDIFRLGDKIEERWIDESEATIGLKLPLSFRYFLENFGGGYIGSDEIIGIIPLPLDEFEIGPDLRSQFKIDVANGVERTFTVPIVELDGGFTFYFLAGAPVTDNEYPVYKKEHPSLEGEKYADNFFFFLKKRCEFHSLGLSQ